MPTALTIAVTAPTAPPDPPCEDRLQLEQALQRANEQLARYSEELRAALEEQRRRLQLGEQVVRRVKESLDALPVPVIGVDQDGRIALVNFAASLLAPAAGWAVGAPASATLPGPVLAALGAGFGHTPWHRLSGGDWWIVIRPVGHGDSRGALISLLPMQPEAALADINGTA